MPPRVVITRPLPQPVEARAVQIFDAVLATEDTPLTGDALLARLEGAAALLPCVADKLPRPMINALPASVKIIANFGAGLDHLDLAALAERHIAITNTPDVLTDATADIAMLLMLGAARRAKEGMTQIREASWPGWSPTHLLGSSLGDKRLGIVGMGRIGTAIASRARGFGMTVHYHGRRRTDAGVETGAIFHASLEELLGISDVLVLACAATTETRHMINAERLAHLPQGAILINPARGDLLVDEDVITALKSGGLAAAGLDVFDGEPDLRAEYRDLPNVFALPHLGSATLETRTAMGMLALDNLEAFFAGRTPPNLIQ